MAALFDLDGTILGTYKEKNEIRNESARKLGISRIGKEEYYEAFREVVQGKKVDTRVPIFEKILGDRELAEDLAKEYKKRALENAFIHPDAEEVLRDLPVEKGLVTNGPRLVQRGKVREFDLERYFDSIVISGEVGESKPEPEIFSLALESLGSSPDESFYVGNVAGLDVVGAKNAGLTSVLINRGGDPSSSEPDYEIKNLRELYDIVDGIKS